MNELNKKEKEFLGTILRPFRDMKIKITKMNYGDEDGGEEYIYIELGEEDLCFPDFKAGTMYKGLEVDKEYTPEELGLF